MSLLRIVCISDTHGLHERLRVPEGDLLIHAGDFMPFGRMPREVADFNRWLGGLPHPYKIVIAGNHDLIFEDHPEAARELLGNATYLENSGTEVAGLRIWGSPVQPEYNHWAFNVARGAPIRRYWRMIPAGTAILVTHGPPWGVLDRASPWSGNLGCEELAKAVERIRPRLHIFGHIHGGSGQLHGKGTNFVNASVLDERYRLAHAPTVFEIETGPAIETGTGTEPEPGEGAAGLSMPAPPAPVHPAEDDGRL